MDDEEDDPDVSIENDSDDDSDEDPDGLFELLPARIRYIDITPLKLQFFPHVAFPILLRDEYDVMSTIMDDRENDITGSCLITGQPSAGKSHL